MDRGANCVYFVHGGWAIYCTTEDESCVWQGEITQVSCSIVCVAVLDGPVCVSLELIGAVYARP